MDELPVGADPGIHLGEPGTGSRLEGRFHFGVGYRFATGEPIEEPEVSLARPVTVAAWRDRLRSRRCWTVWSSLASREISATIMR